MRLVTADDSENIQLLLKMALPVYGDFEIVAQPTNGPDTVTAVLEHLPDLLLVDYAMPGFTGLTVIAQLREHFRSEVLPIVMFSGHDLAEGMDALATKAGANAYVAKGWNIEDLAELLWRFSPA